MSRRTIVAPAPETVNLDATWHVGTTVLQPPSPPTAAAYYKAALDQWAADETVKIDDEGPAYIERDDERPGGAWVRAYVWVTDGDASKA